MQNDVATAIQKGIAVRRDLLRKLTVQQQRALLEELFTDMFGELHTTLQKWAALTGQSAQVDTGYIAQFVASIVLKEPGQGFRGKGDDLADGSEVKSAANISGVDRPRWNHHMGTVADDNSRRAKGHALRSDEYLSCPYVFYLLVDRSPNDKQLPQAIRVRGWLIDAKRDQAWRSLFQKYQAEKTGASYNFQLHPPVGHDDDIVVNTLGNLDFSGALVFDARVRRTSDGGSTVEWRRALEEDTVSTLGHTRSLPYGGRNDRPSQSTAVADLVADIAVVPDLFPGILGESQDEAIKSVTEEEAEAEA